MSGSTGRTTAIYFLSQVAASLTGFIATWFIANRLGSTTLGEYSVVVGLLFWLNVPASAIGKSLNKRMSEEGAIREYFTAGQMINAASTAALVALILLFSDQVNALVNDRPVAELLAVLVAAQSVFDLSISSLRGTKQVGKSGLLKTLERVLRSGFQIGAILAGTGLLWLVVGHAAALFLAAALGVVHLKLLPRKPTVEHGKRLIEFARYSWLGAIRTRAFAWMDTIVLGAFAAYAFLGAVDVTHSQIGVYEVAWSVASMLGLVSSSISQTLFPELSELGAADNHERVRHFVNEGLAFTGLFVIPGLFGAAVIGGDLLTIYRAEFARGKWILVILVAARLFSSYGVQFINAISAIDRPDVAFRINLAFLSVNLVANAVLISFLGWYGAAIATALSAGLGLIAGGYLLYGLIDHYEIPTGEIISQVVASVIMFVVVIVLKGATPDGPIVAVVLAGVGAAVYGVGLLGLSGRFRRKTLSLAFGR